MQYWLLFNAVLRDNVFTQLTHAAEYCFLYPSNVAHSQTIFKKSFPKVRKHGTVNKRHDSFWSFRIFLLCSCSKKHVRVCQVLDMHGDIIMYNTLWQWGSVGVRNVSFCGTYVLVMQVLDVVEHVVQWSWKLQKPYATLCHALYSLPSN